MTKKLALMMMAVMALGLSACDDKTTKTEATETSEVGGTTVEKETTTETTVDDKGQVSQETKTETTVDPQGAMNKETTHESTTETKDGVVVEEKTETKAPEAQ